MSSRRGVRGRRPPPVPAQPADGPVSQRDELAVVVQARFQQKHLSLADPATATVFDTTVATIRLLVDGLAGTGQLGEEQSDLVRHHLDVLRTVPDTFREHIQG
ncbi:hypothetical protein [Streptomyces sp. NPDC058657]|uniref:hypothetical protein n=1 Tax=unclassified Streptomyces TaxID=2593676 RepID=UPI003663F347